MDRRCLRPLSAVWLLCFGLVAGACASSSDKGSPPTFCDVQPILESKCQRCHQDPTKNGAPFPLLSYADTQVAAATPDKPARKRYEQMRTAVESGAMPDQSQNLEPAVSPLSCEEKATLLEWLRSGAPAGSDGTSECGSVTPKLLSCD